MATASIRSRSPPEQGLKSIQNLFLERHPAFDTNQESTTPIVETVQDADRATIRLNNLVDDASLRLRP